MGSKMSEEKISRRGEHIKQSIVQNTPTRINAAKSNKPTTKHIMIKMSKKEKRHITFKGASVRQRLTC
jgi:hypothetical protein